MIPPLTLIACAFLALVSCRALAPGELAPGDRSASSWRQYGAPQEAGFAAPDLAAARATADSARSAAVMVVYRGSVVAAWGDVARPLNAHSVRKSLAGVLYGVGLDRGLLDLDATLANMGIDDFDTLTATEKTATVRDLISARSGVYHPAAYADGGQNAQRPPRGSVGPGTRWFYNNWDFNVMESILERRAGASIFEVFDRWLARPLGMEDFHPASGFEVLEPSHSRFPAHVVRISTRDLARVGQLYLNGGVWNGRRILPREWIDSSLTPHSQLGNGAGYGYLWWTYARGSLPNYPTLNQDNVALARGTGGQALFLVPGADLVIVHRGDTDNGVSVAGAVIWSLAERIAAARRVQPSAHPVLVAMRPLPFRTQLPPPPARTILRLDASTRAEFAGEYATSRGDPIRVFEYQRRLFINVPGEGEAEMFATSRHEFFLPAVPGVAIAFVRGPDDHMATLTLTIGDERVQAVRR